MRTNLRSRLKWASLVAAIATCGVVSGRRAQGETGERAGGELGGTLVAFEENRGQADESIRFLAPGAGLALGSDESGIWMFWREPPIRIRFPGSRSLRSKGEQPLAGRAHYLRSSSPRKWIRDVPRYARVRFEEAWAGVDLVLYSGDGRLEYDFVVAPGADPSQITLSIEAGDVALDDGGNLLLSSGGGVVRHERPIVYQEGAEGRNRVRGWYERVKAGSFRIGLGPYDPARPLVIDPVIDYSTFLGGPSFDGAHDVATDPLGFVYVVGRSASPTWVQAPTPTLHGGNDAFVAKVDPSGSSIVFLTYVGGGADDAALAVAVAADGSAIVTGETASADFPAVNAFQASRAGPKDAFLFRLDTLGSALLFSTFIGGSASESARAIELDPLNNVLIHGRTESSDFPTVNPVQGNLAGSGDAFLLRTSLSGASPSFATYLGGSGDENPIGTGYGIAVEPSGAVWLAGTTESTDFPVREALQSRHREGLRDAFVAKIDPDRSRLLVATYLGGSGGDTARDIALDSGGNLILTGATRSYDFPLVHTLQAFKNDFYDVYVARLAPDASRILFSTYWGGNGFDAAERVALDGNGNIYLHGQSNSIDLPTVSPLQSTYGGGATDGMLLKLTPSGSAVVYSTYLGGTGDESPFEVPLGLSVDALGNVLLAGSTTSPDFPILNPIKSQVGALDAFLTRVAATLDARLEIEGSPPAARLRLAVLNPEPKERVFEVKLWIQATDGGTVEEFPTGLPPVISIPPGEARVLLDGLALPSGRSFPGTLVGARFLNPFTGAILAESLCEVAPCKKAP